MAEEEEFTTATATATKSTGLNSLVTICKIQAAIRLRYMKR